MTIAIVTGGSAGIGQAVALELANRGSGVILTYNSHAAEASETVSRIEASGGSAIALPLDLGNRGAFPAFREAVAAGLAQTWGAASFDQLVNNAGLARMALFEDTTEEMFDTVLRVNFTGPYFLTQALLPLLADGGAIVNTASTSALDSGLDVGYSAYGSSKGALVVLTRYLAKELSVRGIRVNSVSPGPTRTRLADDAFEKYPEVIAPLAAKTALGRIGEPEDVARVIALLLSAEGAWVTGQDIVASGGYNL
jgi:NAD(P)-dependent dehydrogenase (short-subunit alcohol dehydrogenase family)